ANLRSMILDNLNLVTYIIAHPQRYEFGPTTADDLSKYSTALANDLQQVARTAAFAIDHPSEATWPEVYKAPEGGYKFTVLEPDKIPKCIAATTVIVPNLSACSSAS